MSQKNDEVVYLNNCEIIIETITVKPRGTYYLVWKKGKKSTQSNKFQIKNDDPINPREQLSLSLKLYQKGNTPLPRHTHLILLAGSGEQIARVKLMIDEWSAEPKELTVQLGNGSIKLKVKRKAVMKLQKFHRMRSQVEETSEDQRARFLRQGSSKHENQMEELIRLGKQVQDLNFLVDKLKQQRNSSLVRQQILEQKLSKIEDKMSKDLAKLREYSSLKMQMRQSIYRQEIQHLITSFNRNYELNTSILESLIHEKYDYEEQIAKLKEENQNFIASQEESYEKIIANIEVHRKQVDDELQDSNQKLKMNEQTIFRLTQELNQTKSELDQLNITHNQFLDLRKKELEEYEKTIEDNTTKIYQLEQLYETQHNTALTTAEDLKHRHEEIEVMSNQLDESLKEKTSLEQAVYEATEYRTTLEEELRRLHEQINQGEQRHVSDEQEMMKIKAMFEEDNAKMIEEMGRRDQAYTLQMEKFSIEHSELLSKHEGALTQLAFEKNSLQEQKQRYKIIAQQLQFLNHQLQNQKVMSENLNKELNKSLENYTHDAQDFQEKSADYINKITQLELQLNKIETMLREQTNMNAAEHQRMKDEYDHLTESNRRLYEDEIESLRAQKQEDEERLEILRTQYQKELQNMIQLHKHEEEEQEKIYRDEVGLKDRDYLDLMQKISKQSQEFQQYKLKIEMDMHKQQISNNKKKGMSKKKKWNAEQINEEQQEDSVDEIQQQIVQSQDDQPLVPKKKKQNKPAKKKLKRKQPSSEEEEILQIVSSQEESLKGESIVDLMKKGKSLSKLKKKPNITEQQQSKQQEIINMGRSQEIVELKSSKEQEQQDKPRLIKRQSKKISSKSKQKQPQIQNKFQEELQKLTQEKQQLQEKILSLQEQNATMKKNEKKAKDKYQKDQKRYLSKIKQLEGQIDGLNVQIENLTEKLAENDSKMKQTLQKTAQQKKKEREEKARQQAKEKEQQKEKEKIAQEIERQKEKVGRLQRKQSETLKIEVKKTKLHRKTLLQEQEDEEEIKSASSPKTPKLKEKSPTKEQENAKKPSQKKIGIEFSQNRYKQKIEDLESVINQKNRKIEKLEFSIKQLNRQLERSRKETYQKQRQLKDQRSKADIYAKQSMLQSKYQQADRYRELRPPPMMSFADNELKASIANLEQQVGSHREKYQDLKIRYDQKNREYEALENQLRKAKQHISDLEEKKRHVPRSMHDIQSQVDDCNRKILELSRQLNQAKLERDSFDDQIRILKKKMAETHKASQQWQSKTNQAEREAEELKRKQQKYKRQIQQWQEEGKRLKQQNKRSLQQITQIRKSHSEFILERKKMLDEVVRLEGVVATKQTEMIRLSKDLERIRGKVSEDNQGKTGRERELRSQFQKLQVERSKLERANRQITQTARVLKEKLETVEKQNKKNLEERKQTYGQKLKKYIEQIMNVKQIVEEYQDENSRLKIQNSQFFEQNEILKMSYSKLEVKYEDLLENQNNLTNQIEALKQQIATLQQAIKKKQVQEQKTTILVTALRKQLDNERVVSRKKTQKLQSFEEFNERYLYEVKNLKLKLNDFQTNADDNHKITQEFYASQRTIDSLQQELQKISDQYQEHLITYQYTKEDVQRQLQSLKERETRMRDEELSRVIQQLDQAHAENRQRMENQLIQLYNQNQKLRVSLQKITQDALEYQMQLSQVESLRERCKRIQKEKTTFERRIIQISDELKSSKDQVRRLELKFNNSVRNQQGKSTQNVVLQQKFDEISKIYQQLNDCYQEQRLQDKRLLQKYKTAYQQQQKQIERLHTEIQNHNNKNLSYELEVNRLKELDKVNADDSYKKIKRLEKQIEEINLSFRKNQKQVEVKNKNQVRELKTAMSKYEEELQDKIRRIEELNQGVLMLQSEVEEITQELTSARGQLAQEGELYTIQINKLRNKIRQMEEVYDTNLRTLEQELSTMSKELTSLKFNRQNQNSRLKLSRQSEGNDDRQGKRFEEKLKLKDRRIEELKETVLALEEKIGFYDNKQSKNEEIQSLKIKFLQFQSQQKGIFEKKNLQYTKLSQQYKKLRDQIVRLKARQEQLLLIDQQKHLELQSLRSELQTVSKLYNSLQSQIEKRKENLNLQIREESTLRLQVQQIKKDINVKSDYILRLEARNSDLEAQFKKKVIENKVIAEEMKLLEQSRNQLLDQERKKLQGESFAKLKIKQIQKELENTKNQNRRLRNQLSLSLKQIDNLKSQLIQKNINISELLREVQINDQKISESQQIITNYVFLNERCISQLGIGLQESIGLGIQLKETLYVREGELEKLGEQLEQLKFLSQRKHLDYDELKRENYELILKNQQCEINSQQVEQLTRHLIFLQKQKNELLFKEQAIKVQLESLNNQLSNQADVNISNIKSKIYNMLTDNYI